MPQKAEVDTTNLETYRQSCLDIARRRLAGFSSMKDIAAAIDELNAYPNLDRLSEPREVKLLDENAVDPGDLDRARRAVLDGRVFWEHTAAGEATRLKLGTKFVLNPVRDLTIELMAEMLGEELGREVTPADIRERLDVEPDNLLPMNMGSRHMLQMAFDLSRLAAESGRDPGEVLAAQKMLLVLNEKTAEEILGQFRRANYFGFARTGVFFMVQPSFPGIGLADGGFFFDPAAPLRLHNHGQLVMQETADGQIFHLDESNRRVYLTSGEFGGLLEGMLDKISFNIEDLTYLTESIDWAGLALALRLGDEGFNMVMEIVANDPERPIKGGLAAFDEALGRNVMIESFQLKGLPNEEIKFLNKNVNHYTNPAVSWRKLRETGLPMPLAFKNGYLYFQPVQGDINFLVRTAFVRRRELRPIRAWKSAANTAEAVNAMWRQDRQPGFAALAHRVTRGAMP